MKPQFILLHDRFWKSIVQDAVSVGVIFFGLWLNQKMGDSFFANCVFAVMMYMFLTSGANSIVKIRSGKALKEYADSLEADEEPTDAKD